MTNLYFYHLHTCYSIFQNFFCAGIQFFVVLNSYVFSYNHAHSAGGFQYGEGFDGYFSSVIMHYPHPVLFSKSSRAKQNLCHCVNVISNGSPSRIRRVRLISFGITTRPRSSILRTIPVAFISKISLAYIVFCKILARILFEITI